jgi:spore coat polysaccharide biosynthesis predicted glycosyltransferase SpsG
MDYVVEGPLRRQAGRLVVLDDLADRPHAADLVLDSGLGRTEADYRRLAPGARVLAGPDYALVRPEFAAVRRPQGLRSGPGLDRIFVSFGLSDVGAVAARATALLLERVPAARLEIALASDAPSLKTLAPLAARDLRVRLHVDARNQAALMAACDLAVGAGGSGLWERASVGLANLVVIVAENQRTLAERLEAGGLACVADLSSPDFEADFARGIETLRDHAARLRYADALAAICDGEGAERAAEAIFSLALPST